MLILDSSNSAQIVIELVLMENQIETLLKTAQLHKSISCIVYYSVSASYILYCHIVRSEDVSQASYSDDITMVSILHAA